MSSLIDSLAEANIIIMLALKKEYPSMSPEQIAARHIILDIQEQLEKLRRRSNAHKKDSTIKQS